MALVNKYVRKVEEGGMSINAVPLCGEKRFVNRLNQMDMYLTKTVMLQKQKSLKNHQS